MNDVDLLHALADRAAEAILPHFRTPVAVINKAQTGYDPVTEADRAAEATIRELIADVRPDDAIVGEEFGADWERSERVWIIDPIDGTRSFLAGLPSWGVLIALYEAGRPVLGLMDQPFVGERFWADGKRAWWRRGPDTRLLRTRPCAALADAVLGATNPGMFKEPDEREAFDALAAAARNVRFGTECYGYALLSMGTMDLVAEADLKVYDIAPFMALVEQAGGRVTSWDGGDASRGGRVLASGDPRLHDLALARLAETGRKAAE